MVDLVQIYTDARKLIEDEKTWCQDAFKDGGRRCAMTALIVAGRAYLGLAPGEGTDEHVEVLVSMLAPLKQRVENGNIIRFNDYHSHAEVLAKFDVVIADLKAGRTLEQIMVDLPYDRQGKVAERTQQLVAEENERCGD